MDHDQQLLQLREFDDLILSYSDNAQSFATKSFLETLTDLIQEGIMKQNDGSDSYKEELRVIKNCIRAFATILPSIFKTIGQNEAESRLWELTRALMTLVETRLIHHENTGVKIASIKCLQTIVLLLSKSSQLRPDHRLLNIQELEKEAHEVFKQLLGLMKSDNESVLTATISCLVVIVRKRNNLLKSVANLFTSWRKSRSKDDSPVMLRNVEKALKLAFVSLIRSESLAPYRNDLITSFGIIGGNVAMFQSRHARAEEARKKRHAAHQEQQEREKRVRITSAEYVPVIPPASSHNVLQNYDITQIPLASVVSLCMTVLQTVPLEVMSERVSLLPSEGVTLAVSRPGFQRSSTPPYPPPPEAPQYIRNSKYRRDEPEVKNDELLQAKPESTQKTIKQEVQTFDSDDEMDQNYLPAYKDEYDMDDLSSEEEKPKVEVLASVEERASQSLKMKPYALDEPAHMTESDKKLFIKMSIQRIFENMSFHQSLTNNHSDRKMLTDNTSSSSSTSLNTNSDQSVWFLLVAKLLTKGIDIQQTNGHDDSNSQTEIEDDKKAVMDVDNNDSVSDIKELLLDFITEDLAQRHDLALDWLYEEYLSESRLKRLNAETNSSYFYWLHRLLEKIIPTLDAKDRILTKVLLDAPELDSTTIELVKANLENIPERFVSCVSTLRSLVNNRPSIRYPALQVLLDLCTNENDKMRRTSIVAVKKWNANQTEINDKVEEFSVKALNVLTTVKDSEMKEEETEQQDEAKDKNPEEKDKETPEETNNGWTEKDVIRHAELYFVLCTKRPGLVKELFSVYINAEKSVQKHIENSMVNMIKSITMKSQELIQLVREFPIGAESLVIKILCILCETKAPTRELLSAAQSISDIAIERNIDISEITPILSGHSLSSENTK